MNVATDWLSATAMLLSGVIAGFMFMYASMRRKQQAVAAVPPSSDELEVRDLEARRDTLIQQLRDLEDVPANSAERTRLEREAAQVLRTLDGVRQAPRPSAAAVVPPPPAPASGMNPALKGFLWGVASVAALGFLGYFVWTSTTEKTEGTPNAMQPATTQSQPAQTDPVVQQLEAAVAGAPDDVNARISLAKAYLERENMMGVFEQTQAVLAKSPDEPRALTYQALVRMAMGQTDVAEKMLDDATRKDPKFTDAWVGLAWLDFQTGKRDAGERAMSEAMKQRPDQKARLAQILEEMRKQKPTELPQNHPNVDAPPVGGQAPSPVTAPVAAAPSGDSIHLTLNLDPAAAAHAPQHAIIYIIARAEGVTAGAPVAVKRLLSNGFPMEVDFSSADSMMGQPLPAKIRLEVRLDADGDAATKSPDDPTAVQDGVATGAKLALTLK